MNLREPANYENDGEAYSLDRFTGEKPCFEIELIEGVVSIIIYSGFELESFRKIQNTFLESIRGFIGEIETEASLTGEKQK